MHTRAAQLRHEFCIGQPGGLGLELVLLGQRLPHLAEVPALHQRQGAQRLLAAHQLAQQGDGGGARRDFVVARLDGTVLPRQAEPGIQQARIGVTPAATTSRATPRGVVPGSMASSSGSAPAMGSGWCSHHAAAPPSAIPTKQ
jgi:hypothetical protein